MRDETGLTDAPAGLPTCYHREAVADLLNPFQKSGGLAV